MKKRIVMMMMCVLTYCAFAQVDSSGVYVTAKDFVQRKLTSASANTDSKIKTEGIVSGKTITLKSKNGKTQFKKSDLYGFRNAKGDFRLVNDNSYRILNADQLFLYTRTTVKQGKGMTSETKYYFSADATSPLHELTINNLKQEFSKDTLFLDELDFRIKEDRDLIAYNQYRKQYNVIHIYIESMIAQARTAKF